MLGWQRQRKSFKILLITQIKIISTGEVVKLKYTMQCVYIRKVLFLLCNSQKSLEELRRNISRALNHVSIEIGLTVVQVDEIIELLGYHCYAVFAR